MIPLEKLAPTLRAIVEWTLEAPDQIDVDQGDQDWYTGSVYLIARGDNCLVSGHVSSGRLILFRTAWTERTAA